jgi:Fic family protein
VSTPSDTADVHAGDPVWEDFSADLEGVEPKGTDRAIWRFRQRIARQVYNDARLEGNGFTEPEVATLLGGGHVAGRTEGEARQIIDLQRGAEYIMEASRTGPLAISQDLMDNVHIRVALNTFVPSLAFRADQREAYDGPRVRLGAGQVFHAHDPHAIREVFTGGAAAISAIRHPLAMASVWAAFATYHQFYFDGNKRTARYTANALLMSRGFDAVLLPAARQADYERVLVGAYRTGDLTEHARFLADLYDDH